ncbi:GNAT family N-acetyltransferase [Streptomyces sp. NPDC001537]
MTQPWTRSAWTYTNTQSRSRRPPPHGSWGRARRYGCACVCDVDAAVAGQLYQIHVSPGSWGHGIGSQLHAAFVQKLRDASLTTGVLEAWERNSRAQAFYARHGWKPDGHQRPGPAAANYVRMRLELATIATTSDLPCLP